MARTPRDRDCAHACNRLSTRASDGMDDARGYLERRFGILERASCRVLGVRRISPLSHGHPVVIPSTVIPFVIPSDSEGTARSRFLGRKSVVLGMTMTAFVIPSDSEGTA